MKPLLLLPLVLLFCINTTAQKKIVVMGSSTAAGTGASHPDSSWVGRLQKHFRQNTADNLDTVVYNIAWYGQTTYEQMPTGSVPAVAGRPNPDPNFNVTRAASFAPDVVIISLPSNDVANYYWGAGTYSMQETMNNFRAMRAYLNANTGANVFITTTQPRNDMNAWPEKPVMQRQLVDSIINNFGNRAIDFWNPLVTPTGNQLRDDLRADLIHPNNTGHRLLFEQVIARNLFVVNSPLPVVLQQFRGERRGSDNLLHWTASDETPGTVYHIERSSNGADFTPMTSINAQGISGTHTYQWTDPRSPLGLSYYRIRIQEAGRNTYSSIIPVQGSEVADVIRKLAVQGGSLKLELSPGLTGTAAVRVIAIDGRMLYQGTIPQGTTSLTIPIAGFAKGSYILSVELGNTRMQQRFQKLD